jgi:hypothetical protein
LIEAITGCALVSGCLDLKPLPASEREPAFLYWVNPLYSCWRALKLDFKSLKCWLSSEGWAPFGMREALRYGARYMKAKARL